MAETTGTTFQKARFGPPPAPPRDGDKKQARQRINVLVRTGRLPHPNTLPCKGCGHIWSAGERRHEYDHFKGYAAEHHYDVEPVCTVCQRARSMQRGEIQLTKLQSAAQQRRASRRTHCSKGHPMGYGADGMWRCHTCRLEYWKARGRNRRG